MERTMLADDFLEAMKEALKAYGSQKSFSQASGIHQSRISDYSNGNYDFENLTVGTLHKLFPNMRIIYFPEKNTPQPIDETMEIINRRIQIILQSLSPEERVHCFEMLARTYGDKLEEEKKHNTEG